MQEGKPLGRRPAPGPNKKAGNEYEGERAGKSDERGEGVEREGCAGEDGAFASVDRAELRALHHHEPYSTYLTPCVKQYFSERR